MYSILSKDGLTYRIDFIIIITSMLLNVPDG